jgi:isochorismate hydrolase
VPGSDDLQVVKKRYSAFFGTQLDELIRARGVDMLVLAGINTHACVRTTAIDAYQRDLGAIIAREAVGSHDREHAAVSLRYMDGKIAQVMPVADVVAHIGATRSGDAAALGPTGGDPWIKLEAGFRADIR